MNPIVKSYPNCHDIKMNDLKKEVSKIKVLNEIRRKSVVKNISTSDIGLVRNNASDVLAICSAC